MMLCDVNVYVYAHRPDATADHAAYARWLEALADGPSSFGVSEAILAAFVRVVTNPRIFARPTPLPVALEFCRNLTGHAQAVVLRPGARNWSIFDALCRDAGAHGKLAADAWHAALAIEHGCEWITTDSDFARFKGLRWRHPLSPV